MKTKSGWLHMTKTERKEIETVLKHCEHDISFGGEGSFSKIEDNTADVKEIEKAKRGIQSIRWILQTYLD